MVTNQGFRGLVILAIFGWSVVTRAEDGSRIRTASRQPDWGTVNASILSVNAWDFEQILADPAWASTPQFYRYRTAELGGSLIAGVHLPNGALVTGLALEACDTSTTGGVEIALYDCPAGAETECDNIGYATGFDPVPGCGVFFVDLTGLDIVIDHEARSYHLVASTDTPAASNSFRSARIYYRLQVSPAPAQATFGDVPTTHPFFRFVEALAASGITAGCGGGNYCPDNPLTRGQMAVFLASALGLHWD